MSKQDNKAIVSRFYEDVWNSGDLALADELLATDFVCRGATGKTLDREEFKGYVDKLRNDLNFRHTVEELVAEGDTVVARLRGHGQAERRIFGLSLGRKRLDGAGVAIWKLQDGRITERWAIWA